MYNISTLKTKQEMNINYADLSAHISLLNVFLCPVQINRLQLQPKTCTSQNPLPLAD